MANYHSTSALLELLVEAGCEALVDVDIFTTKVDFRRRIEEGKELDRQLESAQEVVSLFVDAEFSQVVRIATLLWNTLAGDHNAELLDPAPLSPEYLVKPFEVLEHSGRTWWWSNNEVRIGGNT
jgi:hypothetical protein